MIVAGLVVSGGVVVGLLMAFNRGEDSRPGLNRSSQHRGVCEMTVPAGGDLEGVEMCRVAVVAEARP